MYKNRLLARILSDPAGKELTATSPAVFIITDVYKRQVHIFYSPLNSPFNCIDYVSGLFVQSPSLAAYVITGLIITLYNVTLD